MSTHDPVDPTPQGDTSRPSTRPSDATGPSQGTEQRRASGFDDKGKVKRSRVSALWFGLIVAAILAILVLVFIVQNSDPVNIAFLGMEGNLSVGVAILLAAVLGILIAAIPGSIRIAQLHRALTRNEKRRH